MMDFTRQLDFIKPDQLSVPITVIGLGGIGSYAVPVLAKMGCSNITGYEVQTVEDLNLPNQFFRLSDVDRPKSEALGEIVKDFSGIDLNIRPVLYTGQEPLSGIVISAVHDMATRQIIWDSVKFKPQVRLYIDGRMGGQIAHLFTIRPCDPDDIRLYEEKLYADEETHELPCTARSIVYTVCFIAGLIANQVKKFVNGETFPSEIIWDSQTYAFIKKEGTNTTVVV